MNLVIDIGNSSAKLALIEDGCVTERMRVERLDVPLLTSLLEQGEGHIKQVALATVAGVTAEVEEFLKVHTDYYLHVDHTTPMPIRNSYATPHTLGIDRLVAAVGATAIFAGCNILVVDLGTAITVDMVSAEGVFLGGNISLGASGRFRALNDYTARLPLVELSESANVELGTDTQSAIRNGVVSGIIYELEGYIARAEAKFDDLKIIFTGGDAKYFAKRLKNTIFATADPVFWGLNKILEYNAKG